MGGDGAVSAERGRRLHSVLGAIGYHGPDPVPLPSHSNDAWRVGGAVLRICYRGDLARFEREALVTAALPASVKGPRLLDHGKDAEVAWHVNAWVDGVTLGAAWSTLGSNDRRRAITQLGEALAELNSHGFPAAVRTALAAPRPVGAVSADAVIGADLNPLPVSRARLLLEPAARVPGVDRRLIDLVAERFDELETLDPTGHGDLAERSGGSVVHGDAHPVNVLWNGGVVALLDWEWVRLGGAELEIEPFLYRGYESEPSLMHDSRRIIGWLAEAHPDAFAVPDLERRMWLIELASTLRDLLLQPPDHPEYQLPADHPLRRLRQIVTASHHLERILPRRP